MFELTEYPINKEKYLKQQPSSCGALVTFDGIVRPDKHHGVEVTSLLYIADSDECIREGALILKEAKKKFSLLESVCIQRIGQVPAGESAIWIAVSSSHRCDAFDASRYIIEEIKKRLLIWKKEFFKDGSSQWVRGLETPVIL